VEFRLKHTDARMTRVLTAAAKKFGWKPVKAPSKRGYGVACGSDAGAYVAAIAEIAVDRAKGTIQVKRVVCVQEMGLVINPEGATIQMEGCITMGLGYALTEEIHFNGGKITDSNYDTYELPRFSWLPKIETEILDAHDSPPAGGGEPAIILMGAVVANALFDATGESGGRNRNAAGGDRFGSRLLLAGQAREISSFPFFRFQLQNVWPLGTPTALQRAGWPDCVVCSARLHPAP
jgi:CO/xanthine dehydrogenase Mo-binding subunit